MRRLLPAIFLAACTASAADFTLAQVLSAPFATQLTVAPNGSKVAWVLDERGARNIWIAAAPDFKGVRLTAYTEDDGQDVGQLQWTPDARAVIYVRGGDLEFLNRPGPNPRSNPAGIEQDLWIAAPGEAPRKIGEGHSPAVSPKGDGVAYLKGGQIWWAPLAGAEKPAQMIHLRGQSSGLRWSPDGAKLAFASDRGNHTLIAVYDVATKSLLYLDASVDSDRNPTWSADGKQIAFVRFPASHEAFRFGPRRSAEPWSIRVATVSDGMGREVWRAQPGQGSVFHGVVAESQILWGEGNRLVFPWERDGWTHLYSVAVDGGQAALLTPGAFEVEHVSPGAEGREVLYSSNQDDIDRRHIWRVTLSGGAPRAVTSGDGLEWAPAAASGGIVFLHSDPRRPARAAILTGGTVRDLAPESIPADFPASSLVVPQQVVFNAADGMAIHGQLFLPPNHRAGEQHPALLFLHGGSRRQMLLGWHYMEYYSNAYAMNQFLASQGYVVLSVNYRSGIGYGLDFREALNYGAAGASEFNDVEGAGLYLRNRPDVDPKRVGLWGGSYGGYLTALGLARASDLFAAGVDFHGVHEWNVVIRNFEPSYDPEKDQAAARLAFESSPMASVKTWRSPVLLIHGDDDRNVPFSETVNLVAALRQQGVSFEQLIFPDEIHDFLTHSAWLRAYHATAEFFGRKLGSAPRQ